MMSRRRVCHGAIRLAYSGGNASDSEANLGVLRLSNAPTTLSASRPPSTSSSCASPRDRPTGPAAEEAP